MAKLFTKGNKDILHGNLILVLGGNGISRKKEAVSQTIGEYIGNHGYSVFNGGITQNDRTAVLGAMKTPKKPAVLLDCGFKKAYDWDGTFLEMVEESGGVVATTHEEWVDRSENNATNRARLMAKMAKAVVVISCEDEETRRIINFAVQFDKPIFVYRPDKPEEGFDRNTVLIRQGVGKAFTTRRELKEMLNNGGLIRNGR